MRHVAGLLVQSGVRLHTLDLWRLLEAQSYKLYVETSVHSCARAATNGSIWRRKNEASLRKVRARLVLCSVSNCGPGSSSEAAVDPAHARRKSRTFHPTPEMNPAQARGWLMPLHPITTVCVCVCVCVRAPRHETFPTSGTHRTHSYVLRTLRQAASLGKFLRSTTWQQMPAAKSK